jgi:hypothetical protein
MDTTLTALLQHMRDYREDLESIRHDISQQRERSSRERERSQQRLSNIERTLAEIKVKMAEPIQFHFSHLWNTFFLKLGFGIGMTFASLKLPDEVAAQLLGVIAKLVSI